MKLRFHVLMRTCPDTSVGQVRGDGDPSAFVDAHALKTAVHPCDESAQAHLAGEGFASVMTADGEEEEGESASSIKQRGNRKCQIRG